MRVVGIVAEYNPFHNGHRWMIEQLRMQGAHTVVCVMSGSFVQRAQAAIYPAHLRTKAALAGGADLVLRLPTPYAVASAESFAGGAIGILAALGGIDTIAFGAEVPNTEKLWQVACLLQTESFKNILKEELSTGISFAAARANAMETLLPGTKEILDTPNNILGVEYCKAMQLLEQKNPCETGTLFTLPKLLALPRRGALHDGVPQDGIASASWLRKQSQHKGEAALQGWVPEACLPIYRQAQADGVQIDPFRYEIAMLARLRGLPVSAFVPYAGVPAEGLAERLAKAATVATSLPELFSLAKSKRFAHSRVRRVALAAALALPQVATPLAPFIQILGANSRGLALLKTAKKHAVLPVSTSLAKLRKTSEEAEQLAHAEAIAEDFYALCQQNPEKGGRAYTQPAILL